MALAKLIGEAIKNWLPPSTGFSPYRSPGMAVSLPVLLILLSLGWLLCGWNPYLWPFLLVYFVIGFAAGPFVAIAAHYNPLITLVVLGLFIAGIQMSPGLFTIHDTRLIFGLPLLPVSLGISGLLSLLTLAVFWRTFLGGTPLHRCINAADVAGFEDALTGDADVNEHDGDGRAPLHLLAMALASVEEGARYQMAKILLSNQSKKVDVDSKDASGWAPLHHAAKWGQSQLATLLLEHGADPNLENDEGITPLGLVGYNDSAAVVQALLEHDANPNVRKNRGAYVMHNFGWAHQASTLELMLKKGADPNLCDEQGRTPLFNVDSDVAIKILLEHGADPNVRDNKGRTALHHAARQHDSDSPIVKPLLNVGVEVDAEDEAGITPLLESCHWREPENADALIKAGADINHRNKQGMTGLHMMLADEDRYRSNEIIDLLMQNGFDINAEDSQGNTALHLAAKNFKEHSAYNKEDCIKTIDYMVAKGADPGLRNHAGETVGMLVEKLSIKELEEWL